MKRGHEISSSDIREAVLMATLERLEEFLLMDDLTQLDDTYHSLMFLGPPGVGKSVLQYLAAKDVAGVLSSVTKTSIDVSKVNIRISTEGAVEIAKRVVEGKTLPYVHLYLPQTKIWNLEGTPSPMDNYVSIGDVRIPVNLWRLDAFMIPLLDYRDVVRDKRRLLPGFFVLDEFNMAEQDVLRKLFQLARSAELGRAKFNPLTIISLIGNTPETNIAAMRYIADPLVDRAEVYYVARPDVQGWIAYMDEVYGNKWARAVGAYLAINPKEIYIQEGGSGPSGGAGMIQTPRDFTIFSVRLYVLKSMLEKGIIDKGKFWKRVSSLAHSLFTQNTASAIVGFLRGLQAVNVNEVIKNPDILTQFDKNVAAYALLSATNTIMVHYKKAPDDERERLLRVIANLARSGAKVLGVEAVSIVISSLPAQVRLALDKHLPPEVLKLAAETRRTVKEIEQVLVV